MTCRCSKAVVKAVLLKQWSLLKLTPYGFVTDQFCRSGDVTLRPLKNCCQLNAAHSEPHFPITGWLNLYPR